MPIPALAPTVSPAGSLDWVLSGEDVEPASEGEVCEEVVDAVGFAAASSDDVEVGAAELAAGVVEVST